MKMSSLEERLIYWLTAICWWIDVRFRKDVLWCIEKSFTLFPIILAVFWEVTADLIKGTDFFLKGGWVKLLALYIPLVIWYKVMVAGSVDGFFRILTKNLSMTPNPNKHLSQLLFMRLLSLVVIAIAIVVGEQEAVFCCAGYVLTLYIFCVDPIPPEERKRSIQKREEAQMQLQPV